MLSKEFNGYTFYENGKVIGKSGNEITKRINKGRYEIKLSINSKGKIFVLARLMYYLFVDEFDINNKDLCVSTKDGDNLNISIDNLVLAERKDLIQGDKHRTRAKLTDEQINQIRKLYNGCSGVNQLDKSGFSYRDLANKFSVTKGEIAMIIQGKTRNKETYKLK